MPFATRSAIIYKEIFNCSISPDPRWLIVKPRECTLFTHAMVENMMFVWDYFQKLNGALALCRPLHSSKVDSVFEFQQLEEKGEGPSWAMATQSELHEATSCCEKCWCIVGAPVPGANLWAWIRPHDARQKHDHIWGFPEIGVPLSHLCLAAFSLVNHPAIGGTFIYGNPETPILLDGNWSCSWDFI